MLAITEQKTWKSWKSWRIQRWVGIVDDILMLNCLVLSVLIVSEGLRKSSPNVITFFAKFQSQFDSLYLSLS